MSHQRLQDVAMEFLRRLFCYLRSNLVAIAAGGTAAALGGNVSKLSGWLVQRYSM